MAAFNGFRSWNAWNVSLWINNDEGLYNLARDLARDAQAQGLRRESAARAMLEYLHDCGITETPDGATYNFTCIREAMREII